jgi:hypothetical protein
MGRSLFSAVQKGLMQKVVDQKDKTPPITRKNTNDEKASTVSPPRKQRERTGLGLGLTQKTCTSLNKSSFRANEATEYVTQLNNKINITVNKEDYFTGETKQVQETRQLHFVPKEPTPLPPFSRELKERLKDSTKERVYTLEQHYYKADLDTRVFRLLAHDLD